MVTLDILSEKVELIDKKISLIADVEIEGYLANKILNLQGTLDKYYGYEGSSFVIIANQTDYDVDTNYFNTKSIEAFIQDVTVPTPHAVMVVKYTVFVSYTASI